MKDRNRPWLELTERHGMDEASAKWMFEHFEPLMPLDERHQLFMKRMDEAEAFHNSRRQLRAG